jgi:hypothetical protein
MGGIEFTLKQGLMHPPLVVRVDDAGVSVTRGKHTKQINFSDVKNVYLWDTVNAVEFSGDRRTRVIIPAGWPFAKLSVANQERENFRKISAAVLHAFARARPDATVYLGVGRQSNIKTMTFVSIACVVTWLYQALRDGRVDFNDYGVLAMIIGIVIWMSVKRYNVFRDPPQIPAADAASQFD